MKSAVKRSVPVPLAAALFGVVVGTAACGGSTSPTNTTERVSSGDPCSVSGAQAPEKDGCNTCTCMNGAWGCSNMACVDAGPAQGGGGFGTGGRGPGGSIGVGGKIPVGGSAGAVGGGPSTCVNGTTSSDGCNTCTCVNGGWACTDRACPPPAQCANGSTMFDGCNNCTCMNGQWACTTRYCPPSFDAGPAPKACGARAGNTCTPTEYCAYQAGQYCGQADAQSVCLRRPGGCTQQYDPVCGCDGNTYGNACSANAAGTGIMSTGQCPAPSF